MPKTMTPDELFEYLDPRWKWVTKDASNSHYIWEEKPITDKTQWKRAYSEFERLPIHIVFGTDDWTKCIAQRKPKIEVGMFGKFWDKDEDRAIYSYLENIKTDNNKTFYRNKLGVYWLNFMPMTEPKPLEE